MHWQLYGTGELLSIIFSDADVPTECYRILSLYNLEMRALGIHKLGFMRSYQRVRVFSIHVVCQISDISAVWKPRNFIVSSLYQSGILN